MSVPKLEILARTTSLPLLSMVLTVTSLSLRTSKMSGWVTDDTSSVVDGPPASTFLMPMAVTLRLAKSWPVSPDLDVASDIAATIDGQLNGSIVDARENEFGLVFVP